MSILPSSQASNSDIVRDLHFRRAGHVLARRAFCFSSAVHSLRGGERRGGFNPTQPSPHRLFQNAINLHCGGVI